MSLKQRGIIKSDTLWNDLKSKRKKLPIQQSGSLNYHPEMRSGTPNNVENYAGETDRSEAKNILETCVEESERKDDSGLAGENYLQNSDNTGNHFGDVHKSNFSKVISP